MRVKFLPKNTTQCPRPGLKPGPLAPESSALTMRSLHLSSYLSYRELRTNDWTKEVNCGLCFSIHAMYALINFFDILKF